MAEVKDIQEYRKKKRKKEKKRTTIKIVVAVVAVALVVGFLALYETIFGESILLSLGLVEAPKGYPVAITGGTPKNVVAFNEDVALITDTEVMIYNEYGTLALQSGHNSTNPCVRTNQNRGIIYDVGYYSYTLLNGTSLVLSGEHDNQIISANVASNGSYALVSASSKYLTELIVRTKNNTQIASWRSVNSYINAVAFSEDCSRVAATGLYSEDGLAKTTLRILDLKNEQNPIVSDTEFSGSAAIALTYLDNGNILLLCDDRAIITDQNGKTLFSYTYTGKLYYYNINRYGAFVVCEKEDEYTATMLYDAKNAGASTKVSKQFKTAEHNANWVYILEDDILKIYDHDFNLVEEQKDLTDAIGIACGKEQTFLLSFSQIAQIEQGEQNETR